MPLRLMELIAAASFPAITVGQTAHGYVARVAPYDMRQQADVDAEIDHRAAALCGHRQVRWGDFSSVAKIGKNPLSDPAPVTGYSKQFECVQADAETDEPAPADWKPSDADQEDAVAYFDRYYAARDRGDVASAFAMFRPGTLTDQASWATEATAQRTELGPGKRRITGVSWEINPEAAPFPGVYVAIDFAGDYPSTYFYCGYLALHRRGPGSYEIMREEQNFFSHGDGSADATQVEKMRDTMCRGQ